MERGQLVELGDRWRRARNAALRAVAPEGTRDEDLLGAALSADEDEAEQRVFDHSLRLGRSFARYHGTEISIDALPEVLPCLDMPCLEGTFREAEEEPALFLTRAGCSVGTCAARGAAACDLHREAIAGLVLGLTGNVRHTRHESLGHGGGRCVDLFHEDPESPLRFGEIPDALRSKVESVRRLARAFDGETDVSFLGISEGALLYRISKSEDPRAVGVQTLIERAIKSRLPGLVPVEISPRPVLGPEGT